MEPIKVVATVTTQLIKKDAEGKIFDVVEQNIPLNQEQYDTFITEGRLPKCQ